MIRFIVEFFMRILMTIMKLQNFLRETHFKGFFTHKLLFLKFIKKLLQLHIFCKWKLLNVVGLSMHLYQINSEIFSLKIIKL